MKKIGNGGWRHTPESRAKIAAANKRRVIKEESNKNRESWVAYFGEINMAVGGVNLSKRKQVL